MFQLLPGHQELLSGQECGEPGAQVGAPLAVEAELQLSADLQAGRKKSC